LLHSTGHIISIRKALSYGLLEKHYLHAQIVFTPTWILEIVIL
jgi:hypothetical protein